MRLLNRRERVSIHAPVKGATWITEDERRNDGCFNPRPREGGDPKPLPPHPQIIAFQSTPP